ncbi:MAG: outer membrane beta-barrel protein [Gemmatimonadaceae bacterium]
MPFARLHRKIAGDLALEPLVISHDSWALPSAVYEARSVPSPAQGATTMSAFRGVVSLCVLGASLVGTSLSAQAMNRQLHEGFWIGVGLGAGSAGASCEICDNERSTGLSGYFRMGGTVSQKLLVGGEINGWSKSENGLDERIGFLSAVAYYYPMLTNGLFLKGGLGYAMAQADDSVDKMESNGLGAQAGIGYDFRLKRGFSLTPYVNYLRAFGAEAQFNGQGLGEDLNPNIVQFGLGFSWH